MRRHIQFDRLEGVVIELMIVVHPIGQYLDRVALVTPNAFRPAGTTVVVVHGLRAEAVDLQLEQAGSVEFLHDHAGQRLIETGGGLGALLRFR